MAKNTMMLYGKNSVLERLKFSPKTIRRVYLRDSFPDRRFERLIKENEIPFERLSSVKLNKMRPAKDVQGVIACVDKYRYTPFEQLLRRALELNHTIVFLDRINDPQNLGVLMRVLACFGGCAMVIPQYQACEVTETVLHVASGSENYVPAASVANLSNAIIAAKKKGFWIAGTVVSEDAQDLKTVELPFPLGIVMGSEGEGIRHGIDKQLDMRLRISMEGAPVSFNVAMACAIVCYEISRQRRAVS